MLGCTVFSPRCLASSWSILMPPLSSAPFWRAAPERILPVCPGWIPTPLARLLKRPETTLILVFSGAKGSRHKPSSILSPDPLAHQLVGLTPHPMKSAANRLGQAAGKSPAIAVAPHTGTDSSHGSAIVTPAPRRNVRRDAS